jgi:hypothetical protein
MPAHIIPFMKIMFHAEGMQKNCRSRQIGIKTVLEKDHNTPITMIQREASKNKK